MSNVTQYFFLSDSEYTTPEGFVSFVLRDIPSLSTLSVKVDDINQIQGIDYIYDSPSNKIIYFSTNSFETFVVDYQIDSSPEVVVLSIPSRGEYEPPVIEQSTEDVYIPPPLSETEHERLTLLELGKVIGSTLTPNSPFLFKLLTPGVSLQNLRPNLPPDVCEFIDNNLPVYKQQDPKNIPGINILSSGDTRLRTLSGSLYSPDLCIANSISGEGTPDGFGAYPQPGDLEYAKCNIPGAIIDLYQTDWSAFFVAGNAGPVGIFNSSGSLLETGIYKGKWEGKPISMYRFSKKGGEYGTNLTVRWGGRSWSIPNGSNRVGSPGENSFLWKPESEGDGKLVILIGDRLAPRLTAPSSLQANDLSNYGPSCSTGLGIGRVSTGPGGTLLNWVAKHQKCITVVYSNGWQQTVVDACVNRYDKAKRRISALPSSGGGLSQARCRVDSGFSRPGCGSMTGQMVCVPDRVYWEVALTSGVTFKFNQYHQGDYWGGVGGGGGTGTATYKGNNYTFDINSSIRKNQ